MQAEASQCCWHLQSCTFVSAVVTHTSLALFQSWHVLCRPLKTILSCSSFLTLSSLPGISAGVMSLPWPTSFSSPCSSFKSRYLPYAEWHTCHACHTIPDAFKVLHCICTLCVFWSHVSSFTTHCSSSCVVLNTRLTRATFAAALCSGVDISCSLCGCWF